MKKITILSILCLSVISVFAEKPQTPGSHKNIACDDVKEHTFNVYIPKSYGGTNSEKSFPVLYISSPGGKPNFMKLEKYSFGIGDRFGHQGRAQFNAIMKSQQDDLEMVREMNAWT